MLASGSIDDTKLTRILTQGKYLTAEDIQKAEIAMGERRIGFVDALIAERLATKDLLGQALAESFGLPYADLNSHPPTRDAVLKIPEAVARAHRVVVFKEENGRVILATDMPHEHLSEHDHFIPGKTATFAYALSEDIDAAFLHYRKAFQTRVAVLLKQGDAIAPKLFNELLEDAVSTRASDIHLEPQDENVLIRFRIDGVLHEVGRFPREHYESLLNRIKVSARLRTDEHFAAQDGAIRHERGSTTIDLRVSIAPMLEGEKVAIRVLAEYVRDFGLEELGLSPEHREFVEAAALRPFGMLLSAGPTGSGKTTTLYALVKHLNRPDINITTIEDPVEYQIVGINQIQVNPHTNLTFAEGLRSIVRQDPDVILVGEIRDRETAELSVNAALTGHLLLSTFHANDAVTAIPRLFDMGIEPFLLSSTLELIVAQRLIRKICESCRFGTEKPIEDILQSFPDSQPYLKERTTTMYRGKGCASCVYTGYRGRTGIFELLPATQEFRELILKKPSAQTLREFANQQNLQTLFADGMAKVRSGVTTLEEVYRVAPPLR